MFHLFGLVWPFCSRTVCSTLIRCPKHSNSPTKNYKREGIRTTSHENNPTHTVRIAGISCPTLTYPSLSHRLFYRSAFIEPHRSAG